MAEGKKMSERFAPLLKRYNGDTALFGTQVKNALKIVKTALKSKERKADESHIPG